MSAKDDSADRGAPTAWCVAVCEDDDVFARDLEAALAADMARRGLAFSLARHRDAEALLGAFAPGRFDLVLLDVGLPGLDGLELAARLRDVDRDVPLVFVTSSPDHALAGYDVAASGYLVKPVEAGRLAATLDRVLAAAPGARAFVAFDAADGERRVRPERITHLETRGRLTRVHTLDGAFAVKAKLTDLLARLPDHFFPIHKSFAVNPERVTRRGAAAMETEAGLRLPVSRAYRKSAAARYLAYLARGM